MKRNNTPGQKKKRLMAAFCSFCNIRLTDTGNISGRTIDHFYPVSRGNNLNRHWNKLIICKKCNVDKADSTPEEYISRLQRQIDVLTHIKENVIYYNGKISAYYEVKDLI